MRYLMLVCHDPEGEPYSVDDDNSAQWAADVDGRGARILGDRLRPPEDATTVRVREGRTLLTDGPFAETKEWIAGFDLLECPDLDAAIAIAQAHPMARFGRLELRPLWPLE